MSPVETEQINTRSPERLVALQNKEQGLSFYPLLDSFLLRKNVLCAHLAWSNQDRRPVSSAQRELNPLKSMNCPLRNRGPKYNA
eukprot:3534702-Rhodomonas_salina.2